MAYQTGTATDVTDLLDKLRLFATANGWTVNHWAAITNGWWLHISKSGANFSIASDTTAGNTTYPGPFIRLRGCTGYNGGAAWNAQPGTTTADSVSDNMPGPFAAYHFFENPTKSYLHVVVEVSSGHYRHIHIGIADKLGLTSNNGAYVQACCWYYNNEYSDDPLVGYHSIPWYAHTSSAQYRNYIREALANPTYPWGIVRNTVGAAGESRVLTPLGISPSYLCTYLRLMELAPNSYNGRSILLPLQTFFETGYSTNTYNTSHEAPDLRYVNIKNLAPGATIVIGSDEWITFPWLKKAPIKISSSTAEASGNYGFAYKKVA